MKDLMTLLQERRSVRTYTGESVPQEKLERVLQAGLLSPTGRNRKPWEFIVVRSKAVLTQMADCREAGAQMLRAADAAVVVLGDREKSDTIIEDCSIAIAYMHLMAEEEGLGSCWIQGRNRRAVDGRTTEEFLRELLVFPAQYSLEAVLSLGIPKEHPAAHGLENLKCGKLHWERF